jgi:hypothetical protein
VRSLTITEKGELPVSTLKQLKAEAEKNGLKSSIQLLPIPYWQTTHPKILTIEGKRRTVKLGQGGEPNTDRYACEFIATRRGLLKAKTASFYKYYQGDLQPFAVKIFRWLA